MLPGVIINLPRVPPFNLLLKRNLLGYCSFSRLAYRVVSFHKTFLIPILSLFKSLAFNFERVSLCSTGYSETQYIDLTGLRLAATLLPLPLLEL